MKLITWTTLTGNKGFCSARCYNHSAHGKSSCICQGQNRGVGLKQAIVNTQEKYVEWIEAKERALHTHISYTLAPVCQYKQMKLWGEDVYVSHCTKT